MNQKHPLRSVIFSQAGGQWPTTKQNSTPPQSFFLLLLFRTIYLVYPKETSTSSPNWLNSSVFLVTLHNYLSCILLINFINVVRRALYQNGLNNSAAWISFYCNSMSIKCIQTLKKDKFSFLRQPYHNLLIKKRKQPYEGHYDGMEMLEMRYVKMKIW